MGARGPMVAFGAGSLVYIAALVLGSQRPVRYQRESDLFDLSDILFVTAVYAFLVMGFIISSRRAGHRMGTIFSLAGLLGLITYTLYEYAVSAVFGSNDLPLAGEAAWMSMWTWTTMMVGIIVVLLTYPTGALLSRRWAAPLVIGLGGVACALVGSSALWPDRSRLATILIESDSSTDLPNVPAAAQVLLDLAFPLVACGLILSAASVVVRFRRSRGEERQQMKALLFAVGLLVFGLLLDTVVDGLLGLSSTIFEILGPLSILAIPIAAGVAILRYGLYEIDVVINRALVYAVLSAILVLFYLGIVFLLQALLTGVTRDSDLAVAASTLAVAAMFRPLRVAIQRFIDRRFYRRKYDAQRTLDRFSSRLREDIDLDRLASDLAEVVRETMQPSHVSVWLRASSLRGTR